MVETKDLEDLKVALNEAIRTSKRLDKCHESYRLKTKAGFSRAATTTYNANSSSLSVALKSELSSVKEKAILALRI